MSNQEVLATVEPDETTDVSTAFTTPRKKTWGERLTNKTTEGALKGAPGRRKSKGLTAGYFFLNGKENPPTRVLLVEPRSKSKREHSQDRLEAAQAKRARKNRARLLNDMRTTVGQMRARNGMVPYS